MATLASGLRQWSRGLWEYYRKYTRRRVGVHAAATAALTGFGLLATINRVFVVVAIAAYVLPPVYLYVAGDEFEADRETPNQRPATNRTDASANNPAVTADSDDGDTDSDSDDGDTDSDSDDGDTDSDSDDGDTDTDGADADADGADADADGADADADGADADADA